MNTDTIINNEYRFSKEKHIHELLKDNEWKPLQGITSVLSVIAKPALIPWAVKMATDFIAVAWQADIPYSAEAISLILNEAKIAHRKKKEVAGDWGIEVHSEVERYVLDCIAGREPIATERIKQFVDWATENKVKFLESEKHLYSEKHWIGGICDLVMEIDGQIWIGDIKTGSGIYPEHFLQMAAYEIMLNEMELYKNITGHIVINLKKDGKFEEKRNAQTETHKQAFLSALNLYRVLNDVK